MRNRREYRTVEHRHEHRVAAVVSTDSPAPHGGFTAQVLRYGPPADDYNTTWEPHGGNEGLDQRLPVLAWAHSWTEPIGRATRWWEEGDGLFMEFEFDDPADVPRARQARSQLMSGTLSDVSIGFTRESDEKNEDGSTNITKWVIDEVSVVLRGAVSGATVLAGSVRGVRSGATVPVDVAGRLAARLVAGDIDAAEFFAGIKEAADPVAPTEAAPPAAAPPVDAPVVEPPPVAEAPTLEQLVAAGDIEGAQALLAASLEAEAIPPAPPLPTEEPPAVDPALPSDADIDAALALARVKR